MGLGTCCWQTRGRYRRGWSGRHHLCHKNLQRWRGECRQGKLLLSGGHGRQPCWPIYLGCKCIGKGLTRQKWKIGPGAVRHSMVPGLKNRGKLLPKHRKKILSIGERRDHTTLKRLVCPDLVTALEALGSRSGLEPTVCPIRVHNSIR